jgi:hypothetical protein
MGFAHSNTGVNVELVEDNGFPAKRCGDLLGGGMCQGV